MPRHRKERAPWYRVLRRENGSPRSVPGGVPRARRSGRRPAAARPAARRVRLAPALSSRFRLARSLLVTPWFAAGAGIVIAAALAVNTPTALTYGPARPGELCVTHSCTNQRRGVPPQVATAKPGVAIKAPDSGAKSAVSAAEPHGGPVMSYEIGYHIERHWGWGFSAVITMRGAGKSGWSLEFAYPSARVRWVMGAARWRPSPGGVGGTASGPLRRGDQARARDRGQPDTPAKGGPPDADQVVVIASGPPQAPSSCTLDGIRCRFSDPGDGLSSPGDDQSSGRDRSSGRDQFSGGDQPSSWDRSPGGDQSSSGG
jgi:hypothetical protein